MARPFDDHVPYQPMGQSSLSSQTVLGSTDDKYGSSWSAKRKLSTKRPKLPKIKSSSGHDALSTTAPRFNNEDRSGGHKRGSSASATPTSPTYVPDYLLNGSGSFLPTAQKEHTAVPPPTRKKSTKMTIKPLLARKYSSREKVDPSIDLSRPAADNDGLAAALSEVNIPGASAFASPAMPARKESISQQRGGYHRRTTSANSQISTTTTASNRYVHPMRQTPRAYTPPIAGSYKTSFDSDTNTSTPITSDLDTSASTPYAALPTSKTVPTKHKLPHIRTKSSNSPRLTSSPSLTNINNNNPGTPSSLRNPPILSDTPFPDMVSLPSGTARSSLDTASTFRKQRSRSNTAGTDPRSQAETVQHLRQKFQEKEAKKDAKWQEKELKLQEKEARKRERKDSNARRSLEKRERKIASRNRSRATSKANSEKSSLSLATFGTRDGPFASVGAVESASAGAGAGAGHQEMSQVPRPVDKDALGREMFGSDVQQLRNKRSGNLPRNNNNGGSRPPQQQIGRSRAGTGTGTAEGAARGGEKKREKVTGRWSLIWFRFKTFWLKITGGGKS